MVTSGVAAGKAGVGGAEDAGLITAARQGDQEAFNHLVLRYQERIFNLAARILGDADAADDITQNTFLTAYLNLSRFRNGSFRSWLYRIATNACYDLHRRHKRYPVLSIEYKELAEESMSPLDDFSSHTAIPESELERHELARTVQHALDRLDIDLRTVVILVDQQDFDYEEAAHTLGIPVGTVKSRLSRARQRLRQLLGNLAD